LLLLFDLFDLQTMTTDVMVPDIGWLVGPWEEKESVAEERLISGVPRAEVFIHSEKKSSPAGSQPN